MDRPHWSRRGYRAAPPPGGQAGPAGFGKVRFTDEDGPSTLAGFLGEAKWALPADLGRTMSVLALSGGGSGGAFGAGALVGLSQAAARPQFDMVTGVSTGSLIAPFAFLGSEWDARLTTAYTGGFASDLLALTALRPGASLYASEPLVDLVTRFIDQPLLRAVAAKHATGGRLFVATANLDAQTTSIWDMGAIANAGSPAALKLFIEILVASSCLPGLFPPQMIEVESNGELFEEMHIDGGTISPMFIVPDALVLDKAEGWNRRCRVYALVNTTLQPNVRPTPLSAVPILVRSFELMMRSSYKSALRSVAAFCEINDLDLYTACIPPDIVNASLLRFDREMMSEMFEQGVRLARSGRLWTQVNRAGGANADQASAATGSMAVTL